MDSSVNGGGVAPSSGTSWKPQRRPWSPSFAPPAPPAGAPQARRSNERDRATILIIAALILTPFERRQRVRARALFERRLCRRNRALGGGFGRGAKPPSEI